MLSIGTRIPRAILWFYMILFSLSNSLHGQEVLGPDRIATIVDSAYIAALCDLAWEYNQESKHDSVLKYSQLARDYARGKQLTALESRATLLLAYGQHNSFQHQEAIHSYMRYVELQKQREEPYNKFYITLNLAKCLEHLGNTPQAVTQFDSAFMAMDHEDFYQKFEYYYSLGFFFYRQKILDRSLDFRRKMYQLATVENDSLALAISLNSLGFGFNADKQNDSAIVYLYQAVALSEALGNRAQEWQAKGCMGICQIELGNYEEGIRWLEEAEPIGREFGEDLCCGNGAFLAEAYVATGQYEKAENYLNAAISQLPDIDEMNDRQNVLKALYRTYEKMGNSDRALEMYKRLQEVKDEINAQAYKAEVAQMDVRVKTQDLMQKIADHETVIERQESQLKSYQVWLLLLAVLLISVSAAWRQTLNTRRKKQKEYLAEFETRDEPREGDGFRASDISPAQAETPSALQHIETCILANIENADFRIAELAAGVSMSQRTINGIVRRDTGMSAVQLLNNLRIKRAKELLLDSGNNITEVAYATGFSDPAYFTNVFKKCTGSSPSAWRKEQEDVLRGMGE